MNKPVLNYERKRATLPPGTAIDVIFWRTVVYLPVSWLAGIALWMLLAYLPIDNESALFAAFPVLAVAATIAVYVVLITSAVRRHNRQVTEYFRQESQEAVVDRSRTL
jgi:heme exporter protein D